MKEVKAIIQPFMVDAVLDALHEIDGLPGVTTSDVHSSDVEFASYQRHVKVKIEIMVPDAMLEPVLQAIQKHGHTGNMGDGHIFVIPIAESINIGTGARSQGT